MREKFFEKLKSIRVKIKGEIKGDTGNGKQMRENEEKKDEVIKEEEKKELNGEYYEPTHEQIKRLEEYKKSAEEKVEFFKNKRQDTKEPMIIINKLEQLKG